MDKGQVAWRQLPWKPPADCLISPRSPDMPLADPEGIRGQEPTLVKRWGTEVLAWLLGRRFVACIPTPADS